MKKMMNFKCKLQHFRSSTINYRWHWFMLH